MPGGLVSPVCQVSRRMSLLGFEEVTMVGCQLALQLVVCLGL